MRFEIKIIEWLQSFSSPWLDVIAKITSYFFTYPAIILVAIVLFFFYNKRFAIWFVFAEAVASILQFFVKLLIARPRPYAVSDSIVNIYQALGNSFPSGHSVAAIGVALAIGFALRRSFGTWRGKFSYAGLALYLILCVINRMYLGQHFLTDVVGGFLLGLCICWIVLLAIPGLVKTEYNPIIKINFTKGKAHENSSIKVE